MNKVLPVLFFLGAGIACAAEGAAPRPNILFVAVDDLRPELGCYGKEYIRSPNIDQLAARGVVFERAYCQFSHCQPSRESLLSGVRPGSRAPTTDLPAYFKQQGYHCEAIGKIYHGSFAKEFDGKNGDRPGSWSVPTWYPPPPFYFSPEGIAAAKRVFAKKAQPPGGGSADWTGRIVRALATEAPEVGDEVPRDGQMAARAVERLGELAGKQPFFMAVGFMGTHLPFVAPKKYWDLYPPEEVRLPENRSAPAGAPAFSLIPTFELGQYSDLGDIQTNEQTARRLIRAYYACVSYADAMVGRVLEALEARGLRENTIVVLWGDNGWKLGEHGAWSKYSDYEHDTHVPLIVSVPDPQFAGRRTNALVELVDIYPSLCALAGLPLPENLEGTDFTPLLRDPQRPLKKAVFSVIPRNMGGGHGAGYDGKGYAIRTDRHRYVLWVREKNYRTDNLGGRLEPADIVAEELYDHEKDPGENTNLAGSPEYAPVIRELREQLQAGWRAALPGKSAGR